MSWWTSLQAVASTASAQASAAAATGWTKLQNVAETAAIVTAAKLDTISTQLTQFSEQVDHHLEVAEAARIKRERGRFVSVVSTLVSSSFIS